VLLGPYDGVGCIGLRVRRHGAKLQRNPIALDPVAVSPVGGAARDRAAVRTPLSARRSGGKATPPRREPAALAICPASLRRA
jgi:hypothetical protein